MKSLRDQMIEAGYIGVFWHEEDIANKADEMNLSLSEEEIVNIARRIEDNFDASLGLNWDIISIYINEVIYERGA